MSRFHLSDPGRDFTNPESRELLRGIVAKQGEGLTGYELACVFNGYLPAGTAAECCAYLLPLYRLFRTPQDDCAEQVWEDVIWIWLEQERKALEALDQYQRIIDELRRIVHDALIPAVWEPAHGAGAINTRAHMLMVWMASSWGRAETAEILDSLAAGGPAQRFILLRIFLAVKEAPPGYPLGTRAPQGAFCAFAECFHKHFHESAALYDAVFYLTDLPLLPNDATGSTLALKDTLAECDWYL